MPPPQMTPEQRTAALAKARAAQQERSAMIAAVRSGELALPQVFERTDDIARRTRLGQVLRALPGYGPVKVAALCTEVGVDPDRRLGVLAAPQRARLLELVGQ
ncbi:MAG: integration host factor, actinobacterial type [Sporichthyaceae bacterium]|jgi:hypothetical protein